MTPRLGGRIETSINVLMSGSSDIEKCPADIVVYLLQMRPPWRMVAPCSSPGRRASSVPAGKLNFVPACSTTDVLSLELLRDFVSRARRVFVITGAGLSTESGIPDYRSEGVGLYARTDRRPMQHAEFVRSAKSRQRYWARNFVGWPQFSSHQPNTAHRALQRWEERGKLHWLVTQNVDALHTKAGQRGLTELHGCAHRSGNSFISLYIHNLLKYEWEVSHEADCSVLAPAEVGILRGMDLVIH